MARIIIVDDDEVVTEIASDALNAAGHMTSAVHDGSDALAAIGTGDPDIVILDYMLPGITGMEILRQLRQLPHMSDVPIVMLTSKGGQLLKARAEQIGADDYLVKPFDPNDLVRRVEALLVGANMSRTVTRSS
jgi:DNA-binding response OmpR family regulator